MESAKKSKERRNWAAVLLWILWDKSDKDFDDIREKLRNKEDQ